MTIKLTSKMIFAIQVAFDELDNSGMWADFLSEKEVKKVNKGKTKLTAIISELKTKE
tara:strand:- start:6382 stop:6552 length:171 start_codon:yes stop_codon:yes gene_type:complete